MLDNLKARKLPLALSALSVLFVRDLTLTIIILSLGCFLDLRRDTHYRKIARLYLAPFIVSAGGIVGMFVGFTLSAGLLLYDAQADWLCTTAGSHLRAYTSIGRSLALGYQACGLVVGALVGALLACVLLFSWWSRFVRNIMDLQDMPDFGLGLLLTFLMSLYVALYVVPAIISGHFERFLRLDTAGEIDLFYFLKLPIMLGLSFTTVIAGILYICTLFASRASKSDSKI